MYRQQLQTPSTQINNNSNKNSLNNTFSNKYNQNNISNFQFYQSFNNKSSTTTKNNLNKNINTRLGFFRKLGLADRA